MTKAFSIFAILLCSLIIAIDAKSSPDKDIAEDLSPFIIIYKNGTVKRLSGNEVVPPSNDPTTGVQSKDILISPENNITARLYLPRVTSPNQKFHVLVYFHGGAFCLGSPYTPYYHAYLNSLASQANVVALSVDYRLAPEHPLPIAFDDSWAAVKWATSHKNGKGPEEWLNLYADFGKVYFAGDSAGANIAEHMGERVGLDAARDVNLAGVALLNPYFWGVKPIGNESTDPNVRQFDERLCRALSPKSRGCDNPFINPDFDRDVPRLGTQRVLLCVAGLDKLRFRGLHYKETLLKTGWKGDIQVYESLGEDHCFFLGQPNSPKALDLLKRVVQFMN